MDFCFFAMINAHVAFTIEQNSPTKSSNSAARMSFLVSDVYKLVNLVNQKIKPMYKKLSLLIFAFFITMHTGIAVFACSCIGEESVKTAFGKYDVIFTGKVLNIENMSVQDNKDLVPDNRKSRVFTFHFQKVTLEVMELYKGKIKKEIVEITTGEGGGDCGFPFQLGQTYLIYSYVQNTYFEQGEKVLNYLYTNICTRTTSDFTKESAAIKKEIKRFRRTW